MSIKRLTDDERASYLIGQAFRKALDDNRYSASLHMLWWAAYVRAIDAALSEDERYEVMMATGFSANRWETDPPSFWGALHCEIARFAAEEEALAGDLDKYLAEAYDVARLGPI